MEFKFNVNDIFKQPVVEITNNLIPPEFSGDRRVLWDALGKVSEVINTMGEASAAAQGLPKPITTAERLRNSDHKLYFLIDQTANNGKGAITGMLKTGKKGLYIFDRDGQHYQVTPPCVLDFYIHESRQRTGLGKQLFEYMLQREQIDPVKMAIDRPSDKLLGFLNKHYALNTPVKQMNNYVVFDGFFPKSEQSNNTEPRESNTLGKKESANGLQKFNSPQGRYGAPRPPCSMGEIIHNQTTNIKSQDPTGVKSMPATNYQGPGYVSPYPNYVSQSTPNMGIGQQMLNNAYNPNVGGVNPSNMNQIQNDNSATAQNIAAANNVYYSQNQAATHHPQYTQQVTYDSQNMQNNVAAVNGEGLHNQIQSGSIHNYQNYNTAYQPPIEVGAQNQNMSQNQQLQYNMYHQPALNNNMDSIMHTDNYNAVGDQVGQHQPVTSAQIQQSNIQQPEPVFAQMNRTGNVASQGHINNPHSLSHIPNQQYSDVNQQFQNLNMLNQVSSTNTAHMNHMMQTTSNPVVTHQNQTVAQSMESGDASGLNDSVTGNVNWNQGTALNTPNNYNTSNNVPIQHSKNTEMSNLVPQYPSAAQNFETQSVSQSVPNLPDQNRRETHMYPHQNMQPTPHMEYQHNAGNVTPFLQASQANSNQQHSHPTHSISQPQIHPQYARYNTANAPNVSNIVPHQSVTSPPFNAVRSEQQIQQNVGYSTGHVPNLYNQPYVPNTSSSTSNHMNQQLPQEATTAQTATRQVFSERNLANSSDTQMVKQGMMNESSSAPNIYNNTAQGNNINLPKENAQMENKSAYIGQDINQNISRKAASEEEYLPYGYPPQFPNDVQKDNEKSPAPSKLERPQSLPIQKSEEVVKVASNDTDSNDLRNDMESTDIQNNLEAVKINDNVISEDLPSEVNEAPTAKTPSHLTNQGYFDIKFYHNKLW